MTRHTKMIMAGAWILALLLLVILILLIQKDRSASSYNEEVDNPTLYMECVNNDGKVLDRETLNSSCIIDGVRYYNMQP